MGGVEMTFVDPKTKRKAKSNVTRSSSYEIGKGKPPIASRFKPGQSGNPKGRPRGAKSRPKPMKEFETMSDIIRKEAERLLTITENGRSMPLSTIKVIARAMALKAVKGDHRAQRDFLTLYGNAENDQRQHAFDAGRQSEARLDELTADELRKEIERDFEEMGGKVVWERDAREKTTKPVLRPRTRGE
jgi:Family of unknown function (DUF5681)